MKQQSSDLCLENGDTPSKHLAARTPLFDRRRTAKAGFNFHRSV
jgi:hypothetical protein